MGEEMTDEISEIDNWQEIRRGNYGYLLGDVDVIEVISPEIPKTQFETGKWWKYDDSYTLEIRGKK